MLAHPDIANYHRRRGHPGINATGRQPPGRGGWYSLFMVAWRLSNTLDGARHQEGR